MTDILGLNCLFGAGSVNSGPAATSPAEYPFQILQTATAYRPYSPYYPIIAIRRFGTVSSYIVTLFFGKANEIKTISQ